MEDKNQNETASADIEHTSPEQSGATEVPFVSQEYNMDPKKRKVALIVNSKFPENERTGLRERKGTDVDRDNMKKLFSELGFKEGDIIEVNNPDLSTMKKEFGKVSAKNFIDGAICLVVVILSYGDEGSIDVKNGKVEVEEIVEYFKGDKCTSLAGKPKLFFIQTCPPKTVDAANGLSDEVEKIEKKIPVEADILLVHSCIPGSLTWEIDPCQGSLFISTLAEEMTSGRRNQLDVLTMMTRMLKQVSRKLSDPRHQNNGSDPRLPYVSSTLWRDLYFK